MHSKNLRRKHLIYGQTKFALIPHSFAGNPVNFKLQESLPFWANNLNFINDCNVGI